MQTGDERVPTGKRTGCFVKNMTLKGQKHKYHGSGVIATSYTGPKPAISISGAN